MQTQHFELKAVLFDLDGTLIDTAADFIRIIQQMCREYHRPIINAATIRSQVSEGARAMVQLVFPDLDKNSPEFLGYRDQFLKIYAENICVDTALFTNMDNLLKDLETHQIAWGIVTNKPRHLSEALLKALHLDQRCAVLVCPDDVKNTKPDPEPMFLACQKLGVQAQHCVYVGDHPRDIDAGRAAQMRTILAAYGYLPENHREDLQAWQADVIVNDVLALHQSLQTLYTSHPLRDEHDRYHQI